MRQISEVANDLRKALDESTKAEAALEAAVSKNDAELNKILEAHKTRIHGLEVAAKGSRNAVNSLTNEYGRLTGTTTRRGGRRSSGGAKRAYNATPDSKIAATIKRSYTRAKKAGMSEAEAQKKAKEAGKKLSAKLGV